MLFAKTNNMGGAICNSFFFFIQERTQLPKINK